MKLPILAILWSCPEYGPQFITLFLAQIEKVLTFGSAYT
jgi:hypothetical protein